MTWQRALKLLAENMTWAEIAEAVGGVTYHAVELWFGFIGGHEWGWQPDHLFKAKLIRLATELITSKTPRERRREAHGKRKCP